MVSIYDLKPQFQRLLRPLVCRLAARGWSANHVWLSMLSEMAGVVAGIIGAQHRYDGPMDKSDRAFAFSLLALTVALGLQPATVFAVFLGILQLLLVVTIWNRCRQALLQKQVIF